MRFQDEGIITGLTVVDIKANGSTEKCTDKESLIGPMEDDMKEIM